MRIVSVLAGIALTVWAGQSLAQTRTATTYENGVARTGIAEEPTPMIDATPAARPQSDVLINFDDLSKPCSFIATTPLRDAYSALGVTFSGPAAGDGGAILNFCGNFYVAGFSAPNFLAFNALADYDGGGIPQGPEFIHFQWPVRSVSAFVGGATDLGSYYSACQDPNSPIRMTAYDANGNAVDQDEVVINPALRMLAVSSEAGILSVKVEALAACVWVMDDLGFDWLDDVECVVDILPNACPNVLRLGGPPAAEYFGIRPGAAAVNYPSLRVAIISTFEFDATEVDADAVSFAGLTPIRHELRDVGGPLEPAETNCGCPRNTPDGRVDLVLHFKLSDVAAAVTPYTEGETRTFALAAQTKGGHMVTGRDCLTLRTRPDHVSPQASAGESGENGFSIAPNPFNAATVIAFALAEAGHARLDLYNVLGQKVATLIDADLPAGRHEAIWDARGAASGVYFARLTTTAAVATKQLILVK